MFLREFASCLWHYFFSGIHVEHLQTCTIQTYTVVFIADLVDTHVLLMHYSYQINYYCNVSRLRGFPSELLDLPVQSTRCFLADVRPPDTTDKPMMDDGCWPVSTMETLVQLVAGKKLVAKMLVSDEKFRISSTKDVSSIIDKFPNVNF